MSRGSNLGVIHNLRPRKTYIKLNTFAANTGTVTNDCFNLFVINTAGASNVYIIFLLIVFSQLIPILM